MPGYNPVMENTAQSCPNLDIHEGVESYDLKRRLYYFPTDNLINAQKYQMPEALGETSESLIYPLSDGGYAANVWVGRDRYVLSKNVYFNRALSVLPWGLSGFLAGYVAAGWLKSNRNQVVLGSTLGAFGGIFIDNIIRKDDIALHNAESVLGVIDRRKRVDENNVKSLPFRAHGSLQMNFSKGNYIGSGTLIGPKDVLTAAHNLFDLEHGEGVKSLSFYPGRNDKNIPWVSEGKKWIIHPRYKNPRMKFEEKLYDIAVIKLSENLGTQLGYFGYGELDNENEDVTVTGYPGMPGGGKYMYTMSGSIKKVTAESIMTPIN